ncbi:MAG: peptidase M20 [Hyphomicrobiales bacterium]|nr:MAG: peptidase M20 [Hyphomicrobiales bacterium]
MINKSEISQLTKLRHKLHQSPEISGHERDTAKMISQFIEKFKPDQFHNRLSGTALAVVYNGKDINGPTILFRCELDALPIMETSSVAYKSQYDNVAHSCGHDGHMAIVASLAVALHKQRPQSGRVILLFQPAEETGKGAKPLVEALKLNKLVPEYSFALHNMPQMNMHEVAIKNGYFNCASVGMKIELFGKTSHASHPENGISPVEAMCEILAEVKNINLQYESEQAFCLISINHASAGEEAFGITAGAAKIMLTLRSESDQLIKKMQNQLDIFIQKSSRKHNLGYDYNLDEPFDASINDDKAADKIRQACADENKPVTELDTTWRASEDFGQFANINKSAMFQLGSGVDQPYLHNPDFNFPDELIETGHDIFYRLITNILN